MLQPVLLGRRSGGVKRIAVRESASTLTLTASQALLNQQQSRRVIGYPILMKTHLPLIYSMMVSLVTSKALTMAC